MKAWITKHALSTGIEKHEAEYLGADIIRLRHHTHISFIGEGINWHRTREAAIARAEKMRRAKIASLRKQIERLEKLTFE